MQYHKILTPTLAHWFGEFTPSVVSFNIQASRQIIEAFARMQGIVDLTFMEPVIDDQLEASGWPKWLTHKLEANAGGTKFARAEANYTLWNPRDGDGWHLSISIYPAEKEVIEIGTQFNMSHPEFTVGVHGQEEKWIPMLEEILKGLR